MWMLWLSLFSLKETNKSACQVVNRYVQHRNATSRGKQSFVQNPAVSYLHDGCNDRIGDGDEEKDEEGESHLPASHFHVWVHVIGPELIQETAQFTVL